MAKNKKRNGKRKMSQLKSEHSDVMELMLVRMNQSNDSEHTERDRVRSDISFSVDPGAQWDNAGGRGRNRTSNRGAGNKKLLDGSAFSNDSYNAIHERPRYEVNKIIPIIEILCGEQQQTRTSIQVKSAKGEKEREMAVKLAGLIRKIESDSGFDNTIDRAFKEMITGGMGGMYASVNYSKGDTMDQEISVHWSPNAAAAIFYDPAAIGPHKEDSPWMMVVEEMSESQYKDMWPDASLSPVPGKTSFPGSSYEWRSKDTIRVGDYYTKTPYKKTLIQMSDGQVFEEDDSFKMVVDELSELGIREVRRREKMCHKIVHYKVSGAEILAGPNDFPGEMIPVVPVFGISNYSNGFHAYRGVTRPLRDLQEVYNFVFSAWAEVTANSPISPVYWAVDQAESQQVLAQFERMGTENLGNVLYDKVDGLSAPSRTAPPQQLADIAQQLQTIDDAMDKVSGRHASSRGEAQFDQSGRAINALSRQSNTNAQPLTTSIDNAIQHMGKIIMNLIPEVYDSERVVQIIGEDGEIGEWTVNQQIRDEETGKTVILNDLSVGQFNVLVVAGPSTQTQATERMLAQQAFVAAYPELKLQVAHIHARNMEGADGGEFTKIVRQFQIDKGIAIMTEEETAAEAEKAPKGPSMLETIELESQKLSLETKASQIDKDKSESDVNNQQVRLLEAKTAVEYSKIALNKDKGLETRVKANEVLKGQGSEQGLPIVPGDLEVIAQSNEKVEELTITEQETLR